MILIVGCGYVGLYTARLLSPHYPLMTTTRSQERLAFLEKEYRSIQLDTSNIEALHDLLAGVETLIITVAAKDSSDYKSTYLDTARNLKQALIGNTFLRHIIYTSSTSVYGDAQGNTVTEESPLLAISEQGKILIETEKTLLSLKTTQRTVTILRLPEIYGPDRTLLQRVERLKGKKAPGDGSQIANLIHVEDIARAILFVIERKLDGIYNLCDDEMISRKQLYDTIAHQYHLPLVEWDPTLISIHRSGSRRVCNAKIKKMGFNFSHPQKTLDLFRNS